MTTPSAEKRLSKARLRLLYGIPFLGSLVARLDMRIVDDPKVLSTACVHPNGVVRFYRGFLEELADPEVAFVLAHEVLHVALGYWSRMGNRKAFLVGPDGSKVPAFNCAHDFAINLILEEFSKSASGKWLRVPEKVLLDAKYAGWCAEKIYDDILKNTPCLDGFYTDVGKGPPSGMEDPYQKKWEHFLHRAKDHHDQWGSGSLPDVLNSYIENLIPQVSWGEKLAQWTGDNYAGISYNYRRPSRREGATNCILAAADHGNAPNVTILWDTSGSMVSYLEMVWGELAGILGALRAPIRVILCDTEVKGDFQSLRDAEELAGEIRGGGGSDFTPAFDLVQRDDSVIIAFTDGHITVPGASPRNSVLWVVTPGGKDPTDGHWGDVLHLPGV